MRVYRYLEAGGKGKGGEETGRFYHVHNGIPPFIVVRWGGGWLVASKFDDRTPLRYARTREIRMNYSKIRAFSYLR
jgi:hypothetical protein